MFPEGKAGDGDRTRDKSLEGSHVTATPHPQVGSYMGEEVVVVSPNAQKNYTTIIKIVKRLAKDSNLRPTA